MDQTLEAPPQATPQPAQSQAVSVDIYDQIYNLRGTDPAYIERLAAIVDAKMRAVSAQGNTVDSLRVAVLAALNIADELFRHLESTRTRDGSGRSGVDEAALWGSDRDGPVRARRCLPRTHRRALMSLRSIKTRRRDLA